MGSARSIVHPSRCGGLPARQPKRGCAVARYGTLRAGEARRGDRPRHEAVSREDGRLKPLRNRRDCHTEEQTMNSQTITQTAADEDAIRAIHRRMIDAWNAGDGAAFAAPFTDEA